MNYDDMQSAFNRLQTSEQQLQIKMIALERENAELRRALQDVYEVWAGSDGFIPQTAPEGYQKRLIEQMRDIASAAIARSARPESGC